MSKLRFLFATLLIAAVGFLLVPSSNPVSGYSTALDAHAGEVLPIKNKKKCVLRCLTGPNGTNYCGTGFSGNVGCVKVINNMCIFELCPN